MSTRKNISGKRKANNPNPNNSNPNKSNPNNSVFLFQHGPTSNRPYANKPESVIEHLKKKTFSFPPNAAKYGIDNCIGRIKHLEGCKLSNHTTKNATKPKTLSCVIS